MQLVGAVSSHAWVSVYCPELGWVDFDPTNNLLPSEQHIVGAWRRDYGDVTPLKGIIGGGAHHELHVDVAVTRLTEREPEEREKTPHTNNDPLANAEATPPIAREISTEG